jgi:O-antigen/teichoic acid export membrane protein
MSDSNMLLDRRSIIKRNVSWGMIFKVLGMALSYISVPIILKYLGSNNYGVWITVFSVMSWIYTFDVGIGNGLKLRLTEAFAKRDEISAKSIISTAYIIIVAITFVMAIFGSVSVYFINFSESLNVNFLEESYLQQVVIVNLIFVLSHFIIGLYKQLLFSIHESALVSMTNVVFQIIVIGLLLTVAPIVESSLLMLSFIYGAANIITGIIFSIVFFWKRKYLLPSLKYLDPVKAKDITSIGLGFFVIQICTIIIFTTDNLIISKLLGPEEVTTYSVVNKLFQAFIVLWYITSAPLSSLYTDAFANNDANWIKKTIKKLHYLFLIIVFVVLFSVFIGPVATDFWLGTNLDYPPYLFIFFALFVLIRIYGDLHMTFLNAIGKLKWQIYLSIFGAIVNIPLSIMFIEIFNLGSSGVILATCLSLILLAIVIPFQTYLELNKLTRLNNII